VASRTITTITDDIDGGDADETVTFAFAFNGTQYEIDLSKKNLDKMVKALQPYTTTARTTGSRHPAPAAHHPPWRRQGPARQNPRMGPRHGHQVSDRGRISTAVQEAYHAAN
jgi:Lsr2